MAALLRRRLQMFATRRSASPTTTSAVWRVRSSLSRARGCVRMVWKNVGRICGGKDGAVILTATADGSMEAPTALRPVIRMPEALSDVARGSQLPRLVHMRDFSVADVCDLNAAIAFRVPRHHNTTILEPICRTARRNLLPYPRGNAPNNL